MDNRYKIILSNNHLYKEIELTADARQVRVGTDVDCDVRLRKDLFFGKIELSFIKNRDEWTVLCSDDLYITIGDIRKLVTKKLEHGDLIDVRYQESDNLAFSFEFVIDFDNRQRKYERIVDISNAPIITVGTNRNCSILLCSPYVKNDAIVLQRKGKAYTLNVKSTTYGVYVNGKRVAGSAVLNEGDFFSVSDCFFYFKGERLWTEIRQDVLINAFYYEDKPMRDPYPRFDRNARFKTIVCDEKIEFLDPPAKPKKPKNNIFMRLLPSMGMLVAAAVMAYFGGAMIIMSAISGAMAVVTTIVSIREANKEYKEESAVRITKYHAYVEKKRAEIEECRRKEKEELEEIYISQSNILERFSDFSPYLFDRIPDDEDYLCVRLGIGDVASVREIVYKKQERLEVDDDLQLIPEQVYHEYKNLENAPIVCDLKSVNAIGVVGAAVHNSIFLTIL